MITNTIESYWIPSRKKTMSKLQIQRICQHFKCLNFAGWETKIFLDSSEPGSFLYSLYKIPLAQACFPLAWPNFHSHWWVGECSFPNPFWNKRYTRQTFWSCFIRCANMKWIRWVLLKLQNGHDSVHRWPDKRTSVLHIWYKYQVKLDAPHSAPTYLCSHLLAVVFLDR